MIRKFIVILIVAFMLMSCALFSPGADAAEAVKTEMAPTIEAEISTRVAATVNALQGPSLYTGGETLSISEPFSASLTQVTSAMSGELQRTDEAFVAEWCADVKLADFMMEAVFTNPSGMTVDEWNYGIFFRQTDQNEQLRLVINGGNWYLYQGVSDYLNTGYASYYKDAGMPNTFQVFVKGSNAYLYMNGQQQAEVNIGSYSMASGDVCVVGWIYNGDPLYHPIQFEDFKVWAVN
jgi:hypothetical protein